MYNLGSSLISTEAVANKLRAVEMLKGETLVAQFEAQPLLAQALLLIEWRRRQAGGIKSFASDFVRFAGQRILPAEFWNLPLDKNGRFSEEDSQRVWNHLPAWARPECKDGSVNRTWFTRSAATEACAAGCIERLPQVLTNFFFNESESLPVSLSAAPTGDDCQGFRGTTRSYNLTLQAQIIRRITQARDSGESQQSGFLRTSPARYQLASWPLLDQLPALLIEFMALHSETELGRIAQTRVTRLVYEALGYAWKAKVLINILGSSRFGKTESIKAYCKAHPGRAVWVRTPDGSTKRELWLAVAEALGINAPWDTSLAKLKDRVRFILRYTGIMVVFDESQFLLPEHFSKSTAPARLNLVRGEIVDRGLPCVLSATPQAHSYSIKAFTKKTQYNMEQWLGRADMRFTLPEEFSDEDLLAVARNRFGYLSEKPLKILVLRAKQSEQFIHAIETIGNWAKHLAEKDGLSAPTVDHIRRASDDFASGVRAPGDKKQETTNPAPTPAGIPVSESVRGSGVVIPQAARSVEVEDESELPATNQLPALSIIEV